MLTQEQLQAIQAPFPPEALSADTSRGFELTSIKAAFVIERLNQVFGVCGIGWRYVHSPFQEVPTHDGRIEIVTEVAFQYRCNGTGERIGCARVVWDAQANDWAFRIGGSGDWSEPIFACGGKSVTKGGAAFTDARKSSVTDGLTKAVSMVGVGTDVFKGLVRLGGGDSRQLRPDSTTFWTLYRTRGTAAGVPEEVAKGLASHGDWAAAMADLRALIDAAKT